MATVKISELPASASPLSGSETVVMNQNGVTVTSILSSIKAYTNASISVSAGATTFESLTDAVSADIPSINQPLADALDDRLSKANGGLVLGYVTFQAPITINIGEAATFSTTSLTVGESITFQDGSSFVYDGNSKAAHLSALGLSNALSSNTLTLSQDAQPTTPSVILNGIVGSYGGGIEADLGFPVRINGSIYWILLTTAFPL